ncbi:MAG: hypothetical protein H0V18_05940 [Pyrinomonadaceae bacterium]|nr:hypothetical protein [Pyrinomonadaceae bacterium]
MAGSLFDFLISCVGLCVIVGLIFYALDWPQIFVADATFKKIARFAVGGAALIIFLLSVKAVFFGGGGIAITPIAILEFAIGLIVLVIVLFVINWALDYFLGGASFLAPIKFILSAIAVIMILVLAGQCLIGGGLGLSGQRGSTFLKR